MSCTTFFDGNTPIHQLDPRARIIVTFLFSVVMALSWRPTVLAIGLLVGIGLALVAQLPCRPLAKRLLRINLFMLVVLLLVPITRPGEPAFTVISIPFSKEGIEWALCLAAKANSIVLVFTALLGTIDPFTLGHAFHDLRVPDKLTHLLLFTLRYLDTLHHEYVDLLRAMKARAFRPRMNLHTYGSYAFMVAMLLVRSLERSERIMAAMKCRGFRGKFNALRSFTFGRRDLLFSVASVILILGLGLAELIVGRTP
jgi:cobalt/nickel transport system permease protein